MNRKMMFVVALFAGVVLVAFGLVGYLVSVKEEKAVETAGLEKVAVNAQKELVPKKDSKKGNLSAKEKGNQFEGYVADCFRGSDFKVLEWNQGTTSPGGVYAESDKNPDFHVEQAYRSDFRIDYYVEAKYLSHPENDGSVQLQNYQIERYRSFQRDNHRKVLIALGIGGTPAHPSKFYLIPLDSVPSSSALTAADLARYLLPDPHSDYAPRVKEYFQQVFAKSKQ